MKLAIIGALAAFSAPANADVYTRTDAGTVHYHTSPCDGCVAVGMPDKPAYAMAQKTWFERRQKLPGNRATYTGLINEISSQENVDSALIHAIIRQESYYDATAVSKKGALGLMQLMPATADMLGVENAFEPGENIRAGVKYLKSLMDMFNDLGYALAAYNAGPNAVKKYDGIPPYEETQTYVTNVLTFYEENLSAMVDAR